MSAKITLKQYNLISEAIYKSTDEQLGIETTSGNEVYIQLTNLLFEYVDASNDSLE